MSYKVVAIYGSAATGKKPLKFDVVSKTGRVVETHLYKADALLRAKALNKAHQKVWVV